MHIPSSSAPDAVIVGTGVIGCAIAFELSRRGVRTISIDRLPAVGYGPTSNSSAIVRGHYSSRAGVALAYESAQRWLAWPEYLGVEDEAGHARLVQCGTLLLKCPDGHAERVLRLYDELAVPHEDWSVEQLARRVPFLDVHSFWPPKRHTDPLFSEQPETLLDGAVYTSWSGFVNDPQLATHNLQRAAEAHGATFRFREEVVAIEQADDRVSGVRLASGERIPCRIVVNVAGPHSSVLNRLAGVEEGMRIKTRALRHEVHHLPAPAGLDFEADGLHVSDADLGIDFRPEPGNNISVGSEGPECDEKHWVADPNVFDRHVTEAVWETQVFRLARRIPTLGIPTERKGVVDLYDVTDDWTPIYDRSDLDGFYMAIGTSGNQFKNAPLVGELMARLVLACEAGHDHDREAFAVTGETTGAQLDLGVYSRLRDPNRETSLSAMG